MKRVAITLTFVVAITAVVLGASADSAFAVVNYNSSKSNSGNFTYDPTEDLDGPKLCADRGGTIEPGPGKLSSCVVPEKAEPATAAPAKAK